MDPFVVILLFGVAAFLFVIWLLGRYYPGSGLEQVGLRSGREIMETRERLEAEDLSQMVAARNARRRARGEREVSGDEVELQIAHELGEQAHRRELYAAERRERDVESKPHGAADAQAELEQLLDATNARRRARGLPERSAAEAREEFDSPGPARENP